MPRDVSPYDPPSAEISAALMWDRSVLTQLGFGIHLSIVLIYSVITVDSDQTPASIAAGIDPWINNTMALCSAVGFALVLIGTISKRVWPLHLRWLLIGVDLLVIGLSAYISRGFGALHM